MSALEFESALLGPRTHAKEVDIAVLVDLSGRILGARESLQGELLGEDDREAMENILCVGTSAGGARAKAILVWDPQSGAFRSGQLPASAGFQYWLLKFDGVSNNRDRELADPAGFSGIGYAYALIAQAEGIHMSHCRLREEGGRAHFMTRRFDRTLEGAQIGHALPVRTRPLRFHQAGAGSCEQAIAVMRRLGLGMDAVEEQVRRTIFKVLARNPDDHVNTIAFFLDQQGRWRLSPAFDIS